MRTRLFAVIVGCLCAACSKGAASVSAAQAGAPAAVEEAKAYDVALKASGPDALESYRRNVRLKLYSQASQVILEDV